MDHLIKIDPPSLMQNRLKKSISKHRKKISGKYSENIENLPCRALAALPLPSV